MIHRLYLINTSCHIRQVIFTWHRKYFSSAFLQLNRLFSELKWNLRMLTYAAIKSLSDNIQWVDWLVICVPVNNWWNVQVILSRIIWAVTELIIYSTLLHPCWLELILVFCVRKLLWNQWNVLHFTSAWWLTFLGMKRRHRACIDHRVMFNHHVVLGRYAALRLRWYHFVYKCLILIRCLIYITAVNFF